MSEKNLMDMIDNTPVDKTKKTTKDENKTPNTEKVEKQDKESKPKENDSKKKDDTSRENTRPIERHYERSKNTLANFLESAEKIPGYMQDFVAQRRRNMSSNSKLSADNLLYAVGEEVTTFNMGNGHKLTMLKMRIEANNAPIYVPQNHMGSLYRYMDEAVGQRFKVAIDRFVQTNEGEVDAEYILLGSIQQAEFVIAGPYFAQYEKDRDSIHKQTFEGVITQIIEKPAQTVINAEGKKVDLPNRSLIYIDWQGMLIAMREQDFDFRSKVKPLSKRAFIGQKIKFGITRIVKADYRDSERAKEDVKNGIDVPTGIRYLISSIRLPYIPNPADEIRQKLNNHSSFLAYIVGIDPVMGILLEVAPGWWIKGHLRANSPIKPTKLDEIAHTPVTVRLNMIDFKTRSGQAEILGFPKGVARAGISEMI